MNDVFAYDDYEKDFTDIVLPEFWGLAGDKLLTAIETLEDEDMLEVRLEPYQTIDHIEHTFIFDHNPDASEGGIALSYRNFY